MGYNIMGIFKPIINLKDNLVEKVITLFVKRKIDSIVNDPNGREKMNEFLVKVLDVLEKVLTEYAQQTDTKIDDMLVQLIFTYVRQLLGSEELSNPNALTAEQKACAEKIVKELQQIAE